MDGFPGLLLARGQSSVAGLGCEDYLPQKATMPAPCCNGWFGAIIYDVPFSAFSPETFPSVSLSVTTTQSLPSLFDEHDGARGNVSPGAAWS